MPLTFPNKFAKIAAKRTFEKMLLDKCFPFIKFSVNDDGEVLYEDIEIYFDTYLKHITCLHRKMIGFGIREGIFTLAESRSAKKHINRLADQISASEVIEVKDRLLAAREIGSKTDKRQV